MVCEQGRAESEPCRRTAVCLPLSYPQPVGIRVCPDTWPKAIVWEQVATPQNAPPPAHTARGGRTR